VDCGGVLLTGGASRRFGRDKASVVVGGLTLAARAARALAILDGPCVEIGPGVSGLPAVSDLGEGPLAALAAAPFEGPLVLLACDLPLVTPELVAWLAAHEAPGSVVPLAGDHPQPLCARWSADAVLAARSLVEGGERAMRALVARPEVHLAPLHEWAPGAGPPGRWALEDADTPEDLDRLLRQAF
jgi:molybdopterin-guanine dinucleotide biosynthesis protein A